MATHRLAIAVLGAPRVERDGKPLRVDTRKAIALLVYVAVTGQTHRREALAELLWPRQDPERARGALRRTLSVLRSGLGGEWLFADTYGVRLEGGDIGLDVARFRALLAASRLREAVALYRGDFLEGFGLRDAPAFDEWQAHQADELRRECARALERLVSEAERDGDQAAAIADARRWLALDPLHEPAHRALMRVQALAGDRGAALLQYRECVQLLDRDLGVSPLPETTRLYEAIRRGELDFGRDAAVATPPRSGSDVTTLVALGDLHTLHGEYAKAIESYAAASAGAPPAARAEIEHKLALVHHRRGAWGEAERHYAAAMDDDGDGAKRARLLADWSLAAHRGGDTQRARRLARDALGLAESAGDARALAQAHNILGVLARDRGERASARRHLEQSPALAERLADPSVRIAALNNLALACARSGELERAVALTEQALAACAAQGDRHREAALHNNLADLLHRMGRKGEAMRHLKRAVTIFAGIPEATREPEVWKLVAW